MAGDVAEKRHGAAVEPPHAVRDSGSAAPQLHSMPSGYGGLWARTLVRYEPLPPSNSMIFTGRFSGRRHVSEKVVGPISSGSPSNVCRTEASASPSTDLACSTALANACAIEYPKTPKSDVGRSLKRSKNLLIAGFGSSPYSEVAAAA